MRLSDHERTVLRQAARESFEPDVVVRLFGSRVDDARRGGDIDLLVETQLIDVERIAKARTRFLSSIYAQLGEQKIDLLIDYPGRKLHSAIYEIAHADGVPL